MKITLISLCTATLLGFAFLANGRTFDAADFITIAFATGLVAWTVAQYSTEPRVLDLARPIRLQAIASVRHAGEQAGRLAA